MVAHGTKATWFIVSDIIGKRAHWIDGTDQQTKILSVEQLGEMVRAGMEIGAHSRTHADLSAIDSAAVEAEVTGSRTQLADLLACDIKSFAYPYGRWNQHAVDSVAAAGYDFACSVRPGWVDQDLGPLLLRRVTVFDHDTATTLARKLVLASNDVGWKMLGGYASRVISARLRRST